MRTILIPVDFTVTSQNAVSFAASWSKKYGYDRIILLKTFYESMFEFMILSEGHTHVHQDTLNAQRGALEGQLEEWRLQLTKKTGPGVLVETRVSEAPLLRSIFELIGEEQPELILLGSDNYRLSGGSFIADRIIPIAKTSPVKLLIVPSDYVYRPVETVLVPCDTKTLATLDKLVRIKRDSRVRDAKLLVLNVSKDGPPSSTDASRVETEANAHEFLKEFRHEIHYVKGPDVLNGILAFTQSHEADLIIALPGKHSFLYYLTNKSISEAIYKNARQPVLILK